MTNSIFVSYHHGDEDETHKRLLTAWSANDNGYFDINFQDLSVGVSINSSDADYIKRRIGERISKSSKFLVLIGADTSKSDWVKWEINKAVELGKPVIAVKIKSSYSTPIDLYGIGTSWAKSFHYDQIKKAIDLV